MEKLSFAIKEKIRNGAAPEAVVLEGHRERQIRVLNDLPTQGSA
jgi:hypothetical protein